MRVTDIDTSVATLAPIAGWLETPLLPLEAVCKSLKPHIPSINKFIKYADEMLEDSSQFRTDEGEPLVLPLTRDEAGAVILYTMNMGTHEDSLFYRLNSDLRERNREASKKWFAFIRLYMNALAKLTMTRDAPDGKRKPRMVYRGVNRDLSEPYPSGKKFRWLEPPL